MRLQRFQFVALAVLLAGASALAQDSSAPAQTPDSGSRDVPAPAVHVGLLAGGVEDGATDYGTDWKAMRPMLPAIVGGYGGSLAFGSEMERSNYIRGGITGQATYDDNAYLTTTSPISNYTYSILPQLSLDQSRTRLHWNLNYAGGFTFNQRFASQNQTSQDFNFDLDYRVAPHVNVRVSEVVLLTTGMFGPVNTLNGSLPGTPQGSNPFVLTPLAKQFQNVTRGEISDQFTATDAVGIAGSYLGNQFRDQPVNTTLLDTKNENAAGFYMHRLSTSNWIGASYVFQHFAFTPGVDETFAHSAVAFDTFQLRRDMTLSFFGGPEYSQNSFTTTGTPSIVNKNQWSAAGGASFDWQGMHTSANASFTRRLADGGGLQGTVTLTSASGNFRRQISRRWSVLFTGAYALNDGLAPAAATSPEPSTKFAAGGVSVLHQFTEHLFCQGGYTREYQKSLGIAALTGDANHNLVIGSISYQFARPWGR